MTNRFGRAVSFLDFDGVVMLAGIYEAVRRDAFGEGIVCIAHADLDLRQREFFTAFEQT